MIDKIALMFDYIFGLMMIIITSLHIKSTKIAFGKKGTHTRTLGFIEISYDALLEISNYVFYTPQPLQPVAA